MTTETLERTDVLELASVVVEVDDDLDVREPAWAVLEERRAVEAREGSRSERWSSMVVVRRCLTCKAELASGPRDYCNDTCFLKAGRSRRAPGRTAARRRRRRGR
jgi:hypothetical protein